MIGSPVVGVPDVVEQVEVAPPVIRAFVDGQFGDPMDQRLCRFVREVREAVL